MTDPRFEGIHACFTLPPAHVQYPEGVPIQEAISMNGKTWIPGETIGFGFLDGSIAQHKKVQRHAERWLEYANLHFDFNAPSPNVRITFRPGGSWSYIGTDCRGVPSGPTMQYGWVTDSSDDVSDRAVILHEMGHMLGLGHEQGHPHHDIDWDKPKALDYFMSTQGWSAQMVEDNVFAVFDENTIHSTVYDRDSIEQYPVDAKLTRNGIGIGWNTDLSGLDKSFVAILYPGVALPPLPPVKPPVEPPTPPSVYPAPLKIGARAASSLIPGPGQPARFSLNVPSDRLLNLSVAIEPHYGGSPVVVLEWPGGEKKLGLTKGQVTYRFAAGAYTVAVYNPRPRQLGAVYIRARNRKKAR